MFPAQTIPNKRIPTACHEEHPCRYGTVRSRRKLSPNERRGGGELRDERKAKRRARTGSKYNLLLLLVLLLIELGPQVMSQRIFGDSGIPILEHARVEALLRDFVTVPCYRFLLFPRSAEGMTARNCLFDEVKPINELNEACCVNHFRQNSLYSWFIPLGTTSNPIFSCAGATVGIVNWNNQQGRCRNRPIKCRRYWVNRGDILKGNSRVLVSRSERSLSGGGSRAKPPRHLLLTGGHTALVGSIIVQGLPVSISLIYTCQRICQREQNPAERTDDYPLILLLDFPNMAS
ncbi:hypothetical protein J6590_021097 [Homalodisca vitripennis]|nr:hypothetical protein J6590_021097 [Homalodisca vitripennis]